MLVLSRKLNESIIVADNIVITVVNVKGGEVKIGVDAPSEISVHRMEVWEAITRRSGSVNRKRLGGSGESRNH